MSEGLLCGSDQFCPPLPDPPLVFVLLIEPLVVAQLLLADSVYGRADSTGRHLSKLSLISGNIGNLSEAHKVSLIPPPWQTGVA